MDALNDCFDLDSVLESRSSASLGNQNNGRELIATYVPAW